MCIRDRGGDDHGARSSTTAHQSDHALIHFGMPILYPATIQEYLDFGLHGFALSRYAGCWVGFKCVTDVVEGSASVSVEPGRVRCVVPEDHVLPAAGLNIKLGLFPLAAEAQMLARLAAGQGYAGATRPARGVSPPPRARPRSLPPRPTRGAGCVAQDAHGETAGGGA